MLLQLILVLANLLTLSVAFGLTFVIIALRQRTAITRRLMAFYISLAIWATSVLMIASPDVVQAPSVSFRFYILISGQILTVATYMLLLSALFDPPPWLRQQWVLVVLGLGGLAVVLTWAGVFGVVDPVNPSRAILYWPWWVLYTAELLALGVLLYETVKTSSGRPYRIPTAMMIAAVLSSGLWMVMVPTPSSLFVLVVAFWIGRIVLQAQIQDPFQSLNHELRVANSDLKRAVNELAREKNRVDQLNADLQVSSEHKTNFLATMSHELRTPLNSIVGYSELLLEGTYGAMTDRQMDRLEKIYRNGNNLLEIINDILDLSKIDAGRLELDMQTIQLATVYEDVFLDLKHQSEQRGLVLHVDMPEDIHDIIGDAKRIRQIITNLTSNAVKFTPEGEIRVKVQNLLVKRGASEDFTLPIIGWLSDGDWVLTTVTDTGIGIAPENQAAIFEEFSQVDSTRTREFEGTGLGLAITRKLVDLHGGTIWVRSQEGAGSSFYVAFPSARTLRMLDLAYQDLPAAALDEAHSTQ